MFRSESELRDYIGSLLTDEGYAIETEIRVSRFRVDILATEGGVTRAIEVKLSRSGIAEDIAKLSRLLRLPGVDEAFVAAPWSQFSPDHELFARTTGVGLIGVHEGSLKRMVGARRLDPPRLSGGGSHPNEVQAGSQFTVHRDVTNHGQKRAEDLEAYCRPTKPFRWAKGKRKHSRPYLDPGDSWRVEFNLKVQPGTAPGNYPLFTNVIAANTEPSYSTFVIPVTNPKTAKLE